MDSRARLLEARQHLIRASQVIDAIDDAPEDASYDLKLAQRRIFMAFSNCKSAIAHFALEEKKNDKIN